MKKVNFTSRDIVTIRMALIDAAKWQASLSDAYEGVDGKAGRDAMRLAQRYEKLRLRLESKA